MPKGVPVDVKTVDQLRGQGYTYLPFSKAATGDVKTPAAGKKLKIGAAFYYCQDEIVTELRFKTSGNVLLALPTFGSIGFNFILVDCPAGDADEAVEMYLSAAGTVKGWIFYKEV